MYQRLTARYLTSQRAASVRRDAEKDVGVQEQAGCVGQAAAA
jgi:hypothetical protein